MASTDGRLRRREYWHLPGRATRVLLATADAHLLSEVARTARTLGLAVSAAPDLLDLDDEDGGRGVDRLFRRLARELTTAEAEDLRVATDPPDGGAALAARLLTAPTLAVELARRGIAAVGVDNDPDMIAAARAKSPDQRWIVADLADLALPDRFDVVVLAGNVVPYIAADRRAAAVEACARHLAPGGVLVAGFALRPGWPDLGAYDEWCRSAGLTLADRWATWDRQPYTDGDYAVSAHTISTGTPSP